MAMDAVTKFEAVMKRCDGLCALHADRTAAGGTAIPNLDLDDVLRAALALAVSAMDAYFRDKFLERLVPYVKKKQDVRILATMLGKASVALDDVLELLGKDRPHRTLRNKVANWLLLKPMHDLDQVDELFLGFGLKTLTKNAAGKAKMKTLRSKVSSAVSRRHDIVHYGDYFPGKKQKQATSHADVTKQLGYIRKLVSEANAIIDSATT